MEAFQQNGLTLAYIGDSIYEIIIRNHIVSQGLTKVNDLHKKAIMYTSAKGQAKALRELISNNFLTEDEINIYKRGRNSNISHFRKNVDRAEYLDATGLEALIGYLYLTSNKERIDEIMLKVINIIEEGL